MVSRAVEIPEAVRQKALLLGPEGRRWMGQLGFLIGRLEHEWGITVGSTLGGGSESYVATARTHSGVDAVVKIEMPPYASFPDEVRTLAVADGRGYARLLEYDQEIGATLQERFGPSLRSFGPPVAAQIEIICATLRHAWEVPPPTGLPSGADKARWLSDFIAATWEETNQPCSERVIESALAYAETRRAAFDPETAILVHGDAHNANALRDPDHISAPMRFKLVDPDGLLAEPAYDLAIPMREWSRELLGGDAMRLGRERCAYLSRLTGVNARAIWEWGFVERVSTGLLATRVGAPQIGREMLEVAEAWAK